MLECWKVGKLESWNVGMLESWNIVMPSNRLKNASYQDEYFGNF